ncbi:hypothetical protein F511_13609 [Dorcoceras hygrometricum]|uniref:Uncharacterized protein n=1 Tax=Dorcoceras hygrometricum TaxID=472368 RepID=A0A2Z7C7N7_9LAMI|nr:hypothetical protein F511_13609 [Dorcoceras hygrometricum]
MKAPAAGGDAAIGGGGKVARPRGDVGRRWAATWRLGLYQSITDSACKNQLVVVSVQYGPFNSYIPIRSTTIGKSRVARSRINSIGYPRMRASGESSTTKHRPLHASGPHPIPPPNDPKGKLRRSLLYRIEKFLRSQYKIEVAEPVLVVQTGELVAIQYSSERAQKLKISKSTKTGPTSHTGPKTSRAARDRPEPNPRRNQPSRYRRSGGRPAAAPHENLRTAAARGVAPSATHGRAISGAHRQPSSHSHRPRLAANQRHPWRTAARRCATIRARRRLAIANPCAASAPIARRARKRMANMWPTGAASCGDHRPALAQRVAMPTGHCASIARGCLRTSARGGAPPCAAAPWPSLRFSILKIKRLYTIRQYVLIRSENLGSDTTVGIRITPPGGAAEEQKTCGGRYHQSGPRPEKGFLRQPALEGLTRSARTDSPRQDWPETIFRRHVAVATACEVEERGAAIKLLGTCVTLNGSGIQLAVGPQPLWLRNHNSGLAHRIMILMGSECCDAG